MKVSHEIILSCRYGGFSLGARSAQVLPPAHEVDDAIERIRKIFELQKVNLCVCLCDSFFGYCERLTGRGGYFLGCCCRPLP